MQLPLRVRGHWFKRYCRDCPFWRRRSQLHTDHRWQYTRCPVWFLSSEQPLRYSHCRCVYPVIVNNSDGTKSSLPACLQSLSGRTWNFVLAAHTYDHHGVYESFICKIVGSDCFVQAGIASSPPATPSTSSKPVMVIQTPAKQLEPKSRYVYPIFKTCYVYIYVYAYMCIYVYTNEHTYVDSKHDTP